MLFLLDDTILYFIVKVVLMIKRVKLDLIMFTI